MAVNLHSVQVMEALLEEEEAILRELQVSEFNIASKSTYISLIYLRFNFSLGTNHRTSMRTLFGRGALDFNELDPADGI